MALYENKLFYVMNKLFLEANKIYGIENISIEKKIVNLKSRKEKIRE